MAACDIKIASCERDETQQLNHRRQRSVSNLKARQELLTGRMNKTGLTVGVLDRAVIIVEGLHDPCSATPVLFM
jgi:hypothetical protein